MAIFEWRSINASSSSNYKLFEIDFGKSMYFGLVLEYLSKRFFHIEHVTTYFQ